MSDYRNSAGTDFDNLFDPDVVGDGPSATHYALTSGALLKYAAAKYGSPGPTVGYRNSAGVDWGTQWAAKGTAAYVKSNPGYTAFTATAGNTKGQTLTAAAIISLNSDGTWTASQSGNSSGLWYQSQQSGIGNNYQVLFTWTKTGGNVTDTVSNGASGWTTISGTVSFQISFTASVAQGQTDSCSGTLNIQIRNMAGTVLSNINVTGSTSNTGIA